MSRKQNRPMSMESVLDEERKEVLALLSNSPARRVDSTSSVSERSISPRGPRSPVRSMLDVGDDNASISSSSSRRNVPLGSPPPVRSMLDIDTPPPKPSTSRPNSPEELKPPPSSKVRSMSDTSSVPSFGPRAGRGRPDPTSDYKFANIITGSAGQGLPKRHSPAADALRGHDLSSVARGGERGGHHYLSGRTGRRSISAGRGSKSRSPHGRLGWGNLMPNTSGRLQQTPGIAVLDDGTVVDISHAYRKLSDANLAASRGSLSQLPAMKRPSAAEEPGSGRLAKDYLLPDDEDEYADSSDDDNNTNDSSDDEGVEVAARQPQPRYRSLLDEPQITVTGPGGERARSTKPAVHPSTAFDHTPGSEPPSALASDDDQEVTDIKRAQKLKFQMTPIISTHESCRAVRVIYRGEYDELRKTATEDNRRLRKYLVATDLSEESNHALEWAVGTVLRDGDTLLAIYCVDEETGIYSSDDALVPDDTRAHKEQAAAIEAVTSAREPSSASTPMFSQLARASGLGFGSRSSSPAPGTSRERERERERERAEEERRRAVDEITERVTKLLRKTNLQVKVVVEVIHCKNPKHLITEVIDLVNPTLVILGSRGRSALKGVILGSFSNYLVTKSSVPVMVARKRLKKQSKYKRGPMRQVNNLSNPVARSLANAKVD
ncbi:adenine nucleotide alpha hydrolases-like protein [Sodiomyces alkalinus F11]|uniref:Adenine nucleotide alpha hydrolases-like protein n=1 Tax=Sodiomyces alkalinus (strain CBS 110278 / VKM F-3762 / F11) TaxID=1314773 RepID=A0A3N2PQM8_SODAK|nr:adenine nucleotide alpha hydrolases-like protein [Sodiomyces alkalinus F11]ROT36666.1 adenine nucleotide alpha hydrolases-like protein [Sodiomyces alkalinus F11]